MEKCYSRISRNILKLMVNTLFGRNNAGSGSTVGQSMANVIRTGVTQNIKGC